MTKKKGPFKPMPTDAELEKESKKKTGRKPYCADSKADAPQKKKTPVKDASPSVKTPSSGEKTPIDRCIEVTTKMLNGLRPERLAEVVAPQNDRSERKHAALRIADSICCTLDPYALEAFADAVRRHMTNGRQVLELKNGLPDEKDAPCPEVKPMKQASGERKLYHDSKGFSGPSGSIKLKDAIDSVEAAVRKLEPAALDFILAGRDEGLKDAEKNILRKTSARQIAEGLRGAFDPNAMVHLAEAIIDLMAEETGSIHHVLDISKQNRGFHGRYAEEERKTYFGSEATAESLEGALKRTLREAAPGTVGAGLGTNMSREQLKAKLGDHFIPAGALKPAVAPRPIEKISPNKPADTVTLLLQEALKRVVQVDEIDLDNVHEQLSSLEGVLTPVLIESNAGLAGYTNEEACEISASDPAVIIQVKSLINMLATHHNRMMVLMERIEYLRNRVVI